MKDPKSLDSNILFLIGKITKRIHGAVTQEFTNAGYDVTVEQFSVLAFLWYEEGVNQQRLAEELDRDKTTIARIIRNMEKKNLLIRIADKADQRNKLIYLTTLGKELQDKMVLTAGKVYTKALHSLSQSELSDGLVILKKINKNLD